VVPLSGRSEGGPSRRDERALRRDNRRAGVLGAAACHVDVSPADSAGLADGLKPLAISQTAMTISCRKSDRVGRIPRRRGRRHPAGRPEGGSGLGGRPDHHPRHCARPRRDPRALGRASALMIASPSMRLGPRRVLWHERVTPSVIFDSQALRRGRYRETPHRARRSSLKDRCGAFGMFRTNPDTAERRRARTGSTSWLALPAGAVRATAVGQPCPGLCDSATRAGTLRDRRGMGPGCCASATSRTMT